MSVGVPGPGVQVGVFVGTVGVGVRVGVRVGVLVGTPVGVLVGGTPVGVEVAVGVRVGVRVGVFVGGGIYSSPHNRKAISVWSIPKTVQSCQSGPYPNPSPGLMSLATDRFVLSDGDNPN